MYTKIIESKTKTTTENTIYGTKHKTTESCFFLYFISSVEQQQPIVLSQAQMKQAQTSVSGAGKVHKHQV